MDLTVYTVTPPFDEGEGAVPFPNRLRATAKHSELAGWHGILVPHSLHDLDPWYLAASVAEQTQSLIPLIAVQPATLPPHTAAAMAASFSELYGRVLYFNVVAGARDDEMRQIGDILTHDMRYERLAEYVAVLQSLLRGEEVTSQSKYYTYNHHRLAPYPEMLKRCQILIAGSSPASIRVAAQYADVAVTHPTPIEEWRDTHLRALAAGGFRGEIGIRLGIICRPTSAEAWALATNRFPASWQGEQHTLLKTRSTNTWSRELAELAIAEQQGAGVSSVYWLGAFRSGHASAPFLVGSYDEVASALQGYLKAGATHLLLNGVHPDDFEHTATAICQAAAEIAPS